MIINVLIGLLFVAMVYSGYHTYRLDTEFRSLQHHSFREEARINELVIENLDLAKKYEELRSEYMRTGVQAINNQADILGLRRDLEATRELVFAVSAN